MQPNSHSLPHFPAHVTPGLGKARQDGGFRGVGWVGSGRLWMHDRVQSAALHERLQNRVPGVSVRAVCCRGVAGGALWEAAGGVGGRSWERRSPGSPSPVGDRGRRACVREPPDRSRHSDPGGRRRAMNANSPAGAAGQTPPWRRAAAPSDERQFTGGAAGQTPSVGCRPAPSADPRGRWPAPRGPTVAGEPRRRRGPTVGAPARRTVRSRRQRQSPALS